MVRTLGLVQWLQAGMHIECRQVDVLISIVKLSSGNLMYMYKKLNDYETIQTVPFDYMNWSTSQNVSQKPTDIFDI